jgi:hypothetical protein
MEQLGVPPAEIAISIVNDEIADPEITIINNSDTVQFNPPFDCG